ncbi:cytochrome d ubiquinol oxidase subunit II [Paracoccus sp. 1_MG-2023]|uniref:cytochrome d ubiquinol oxidase subunit II n=1 Tax=unclassified Paracoccus (in: a-proteobacteria) TaxID=2688777 RepID=UPI001C08BFC0|nr:MULTISPECIES: cytochrome d ubiquinol oxidase subunit II [unclassified Paracoccus (in: a-proteobacteria)]MBU2957285.1 cytochrome d ubiquinol oxidase subunit II [Paracoccus sp. C2R09]MDO6669947.1 cytochrome d ubiquinol oxidase subunit II [Paracoccus sp. 1_MG-2023]
MPIVEGFSFDLTVIWAFVIAFAVLVYVVLDGFDLGLGMLFAAEPESEDRDVMMNSVAPVWDGNETWLVLGGGGLFAAFPLAYSLILPALYAPIIAMLLALIFRGVAFEFRWRTKRWRGVWDLAFIGGSGMAAFAQGVTLGGLLQGITIDKAARSYAGGWWDWLTPFSVMVGLAVMAGYMLLGATWLVMKTEGRLRDRMRARAWVLGLATVLFIGAVSLWTPFLQDGYYSRWFTGWARGLALGVAVAVLVLALGMFRTLRVRHHDYWPFVFALGMFVLGFAGLGFSMFPYIVPTEVTIWEAAAPRNSQMFMLVGAAVLVPIILIYTALSYWVFRGKVDPDAGYH